MLKKIAFMLFGIVWVATGVGIFYAGTGDVTVTYRMPCEEMTPEVLDCDGELFIKPGKGEVVATALPYNEATYPYIACTFDMSGKFFCVNTKTGKIWVPARMGIIV